MRISLLLKTSQVKQESIPDIIVLANTSTSIGRCGNVQIDTDKGHEISRIHCIIYCIQQKDSYNWVIEDKKSLNGTFVNGYKIKRKILHSNDEVILGGGAIFLFGERLTTSEYAPIKYRFFVPSLPIKFAKLSNQNQELKPYDKCDICYICYDYIIDENKLPCNHSFCNKCLKKWIDECQIKFRPLICPMCRSEFGGSCYNRNEFDKYHDFIVFSSIEPFLRCLELNSLKALKKYHIFKKWNEEKKQKFWSLYDKIKYNEDYQSLFLQIVKASTNSIFSASAKNLKTAIKNFLDEDIEEESNLALMNRLFLYISDTFKPPEKNYSNYECANCSNHIPSLFVI